MRKAIPLVVLALSCAATEASRALPVAQGQIRAKEAVVQGIVSDGAHQYPSGALVVLAPADATDLYSLRPAGLARTDGNGRFRIEGVPPGRYSLSVTTPTATAARIDDLVIHPGRVPPPVSLIVGGPGITISGSVRGPQGPLSGDGIVRLLSFSGWRFSALFPELRDGRFAARVPPAQYVAVAQQGDGDPVGRAVLSAQPHDLSFEVRELPRMAAPTVGEVAAWIAGDAVRLQSVLPETPRADLQGLRSVVGDARIVALGEATHGTREFFQFKHRMLEFLVEDLGFNVFAIEASLPESLALNRYLAEGTGDPAALLAGLHFWTWDTEEVLAMIRWMRRHNERHPDRRVRFFGFDMQYSADAGRQALAYLEGVDPGYAKRAAAALAPLLAKDSAKTYPDLPEAEQRRVQSVIADVEQRLARERPVAMSVAQRGAWSVASRCARVLGQAEEMYRSGDIGGDVVRERAMSENVRWIMSQEPTGTRMVLWAHNGHIAMRGDLGLPTLGEELRTSYGRGYLSIGLLFGRGSFRARDRTSPKASGVVPFDVPPAPSGFLEAMLASAGIPLFAVDLRQTCSVGRWPRRGGGASCKRGASSGSTRPTPRAGWLRSHRSRTRSWPRSRRACVRCARPCWRRSHRRRSPTQRRPRACRPRR